jgi:hypothetical protein
MVQFPALDKETTAPDTVQVPLAVYVTGKPDEADPDSVKPPSARRRAFGCGNVIDCAVATRTDAGSI